MSSTMNFGITSGIIVVLIVIVIAFANRKRNRD
jgi:hypothetical protein